MRSQFKSLVSMFSGPTGHAARDVAHNFPVAESKRTSQMVQAALAKMGLWHMRMPLMGRSVAPKPTSAPRLHNDGH